MKQAHTEENIVHTDDEQNTGNHKLPEAPDATGADRFGGTRAGSQNVEQKTDETEVMAPEPDAKPS